MLTDAMSGTYCLITDMLRDGLELSTYWLPYYRSAPAESPRNDVTPQPSCGYLIGRPALWSWFNDPNANAGAIASVAAIPAPPTLYRRCFDAVSAFPPPPSTPQVGRLGTVEGI